MKILLQFSFLLVLAFLVACNPSPEESAQIKLASAENNLLDRHEKVMQQAGQLYELKSKIGSATPAAAPYLQGLQAADNAMMSWMNKYHPDSTATKPKRLVYFQQQQAALALVEKQLQGTIDSANAFVKQLPAAH